MELTAINPNFPEQGATLNTEPGQTSSVTGPDEEAMKRFDLETMFNKVKDKEASFQEKRVQSKNKLQMLKVDILKKVFMMMRDLGVDMNSPEDISRFLQNLETEDPDLLTLFESAINGLMMEEQAPAQGMENIPDPAQEFAPGGSQGQMQGPAQMQEGESNLMEKNLAPERGVVR